MFRIYSKKQISKEIFSVNLTADEVKIVLKGNLFKDYPELKPEEYVVLEQEHPFINPIWTGVELREMTREEQIVILKKIELIQEGEWIENNELKKIEYDPALNYLKKSWNKEVHAFEEGATEQELKEDYFKSIDTWKKQVMEIGYNFKEHQQRCREKDIALLGFTLQTATVLIAEVEKYQKAWAFNDEDVIVLDQQDIIELCKAGEEFVSTVYIIEAKFKAAEVDRSLKIEDFKNEINKLSSCKCYEEVKDV